jgi:hypothetical protein
MPQFGAQIDTLRIPVKGLTPEQGTSFPGSPTEGLMFHRTDLKQAFIYLNTQWVQIDNVTGGTASNVTDGDKGVITVTGGVWALDANTVGSSQIQAGAISGGVGGPIADGTITDADVSATAAIATSKISGLDTALAGKVPTTRSVIAGNGLAGGGTLASDVTVNVGAGTGITVNADDIAVNRTTVDAWYVDVGGDTMTGPLTLSGDPTQPLQAATKQYADNLAQGLDAKQSARVATTSTIPNFNTAAPNVMDGVSLVQGDRILVKDQTAPNQNGLYVVTTLGTGANGVWTRAADMDTWAEVPAAYVFVEEGSVNADTGWLSTANQGGTLGTSNIPWVQFSGGGSITAGAGMTKAGNTLDVVAGDTTLTVAADDIRVNTSVIATVASLAGYTPTSRTVTAGAGLTGGGDLSANRTLDVGAGPGITVNADTIQVANDGITNAMLADGAVVLTAGSNDTTGILPIAKGGTQANNAKDARGNLSAATIQTGNVPALTAGAYTTIATPFSGPGIIVQFYLAASMTGIELDVKLIAGQPQVNQTSVQVKADVAFAANAIIYVLTVIDSN